METLKKRLKAFLKNNQISAKAAIIWLSAGVLLLTVCIVLMGLSSGPQIFPVYISEISASNVSYPNADGRCADYIELCNSADYTVDLSGFQLGDIAGSTRYAFPAGTVLAPGEYLVVYCDRTVEGYAPFGVSRSGNETFYLIAANSAIVDRVVTLPSDPDEAMARQEDGSWVLASPTPGRANTDSGVFDVHNNSVSSVRITEFSSAQTGFSQGISCDWVELYNQSEQPVDISGYILSDNIGNDKYHFPTGTVLAPGAYLVVWCAENPPSDGFAPFGLSQTEEESVVLKNPSGMVAQVVKSKPLTAGSWALQADGNWAVCEDPTPGYENSAKGRQAFLSATGAKEGIIVISEVMAKQCALLPDGNGEFSDWVELYNAGSTAISLAGWHLSDDPAVPDKWTFPEVEIGPGQHLLVFCSGRDGLINEKIHADFSLSVDGEQLLLTAWTGSVVDSVSFGASQTNCSFLFSTAEATLCEYPSPGFENTTAGYEQFCASLTSAGPLAIWEVMTANDRYLPQALGVCYDWVELRNISQKAVSLSDFSLTDDPDSPLQYPLPDITLRPGESCCLFLSGDQTLGSRHAPFALSALEDQLLLYRTDGSLTDYVYLKDLPAGFSCGRDEKNGGFFYMEPTPQAANKEGYRLISASPVSDFAPGVYTGEEAFTVELRGNGPIYYTINGSEPDEQAAQYAGPLTLTETTVLRAACIEPGKRISDIYTATFLLGVQHDLPVVSLVTDPGNLWGPKGVYRSGDLSVKDVQFAGNLAYSGNDGKFSIGTEMSLRGEVSLLSFDKKSFTVRFQNSYDGPLYYDVFEDGEVTAFRSLILRAAHESTYSTHMHDTLINHVASQCSDSVICQKYKYTALYLNGQYWGIYAIREHHSPTHYASYTNLPAESVEMVRYATTQQNSLHSIYDYVGTHSLSVPENYAYVKTVLDVESFADWIIFQAYMCNIDIYANMRYYRSPVDGLWRCGLSDLDLGMVGSHAAFDELAGTFSHGQFVRALYQSKEFRELLARRLAELLRGPLSDENMIALIDSMAAQIATEAPLEQERWGTPVRMWEQFVQNMRDFCDGRSDEMIHSLCRQFNWSDAQASVYFGDLVR